MKIPINELIAVKTQEYFSIFYNQNIEVTKISIQKTKQEFVGDFTIVCFPFLVITKKSPDQTAQELGQFLKDKLIEIEDFNIIKGFLNLKITSNFWIDFLAIEWKNSNYGIAQKSNKGTIVIEYSSPNTNKPLHLGHIRNNLLGYSVAEILRADGYDVKKVNLVNDRGIHICKSMLAWQKWGNGETPDTSGLKGDHLIGKYYVLFDKKYKEQINELISKGIGKDIAEKQAPLLLEAQGMLLKWEKGDKEVRDIWQQLNNWVYDGFEVTYKRMGVDFDKTYYESETYLLGKEIVKKGFEDGVFVRKDNQSIWVNLTEEGLDEKLLLRGDGTSVYMTQDLGTAKQRYEEFQPQKMIYVVGNEQNYHFDVLKLILNKKLEFDWAKEIYHLSYGMVELPSGKMKSREGTVVDADDLMDEMVNEAKNQTVERGKIDQFSELEANNLFNIIGLGALKYFILKVDPKKNMLFNPEQSIDLAGNTGPFIQYTNARICSLLAKYDNNLEKIEINNLNVYNNLTDSEINIIKQLYDFPNVIHEASLNLSPALIANYTYELVKMYNSFYQDLPILKENDDNKKKIRIIMSVLTQKIIENSMKLLGINVPTKM